MVFVFTIKIETMRNTIAVLALSSFLAFTACTKMKKQEQLRKRLKNKQKTLS